jgi:hypothetical protein
MHGFATPMMDSQGEYQLATAMGTLDPVQSSQIDQALPTKQAYDMHRSMVEWLKDYTESISGPLPGRTAVRQMAGNAEQLAGMIGMLPRR